MDLGRGLLTPEACVEGQHALLILVHSAPSRAAHRSAIRSTWANDTTGQTKLVFLIGRSELDHVARWVTFEFGTLCLAILLNTILLRLNFLNETEKTCTADLVEGGRYSRKAD